FSVLVSSSIESQRTRSTLFPYTTLFRSKVVAAILIIGGYNYLALVGEAGTKVAVLPDAADFIHVPGNILIVFVSVVFVHAPTVFRIVRGITLDIKTRDYVAAAQTRGERPWYIMLWEILPKARGPLIVDFCLRIGYTTILLGTLGFFGLGLSDRKSGRVGKAVRSRWWRFTLQ